MLRSLCCNFSLLFFSFFPLRMTWIFLWFFSKAKHLFFSIYPTYIHQPTDVYVFLRWDTRRAMAYCLVIGLASRPMAALERKVCNFDGFLQVLGHFDGTPVEPTDEQTSDEFSFHHESQNFGMFPVKKCEF